jgi:hypothetical protein
MFRRIAALVVHAAFLGGCSYSYDLVATVHQGRLVIAVDRNSSQQPTCIRRIEVAAEDETEASWRESVGYSDDCANKFPLPYGGRLVGHHQPATSEIVARPLRRETVYQVRTTSGATGYGSGRFLVHANGTVENLPLEAETSEVTNGS